ncbi:MAG: beta-ketoacyl synthase chain length factor [Chitinivibrionales bacterium]
MLYNNLRGITAWGPGIREKSGWRKWFSEPYLFADTATDEANLTPPLEELSKREKRRISRLSSIALESAFNICPKEERGEIETVFATRHGEIDTTIKLLYEIAGKEPVSPFKFSHSVHNTPASHFSILSSNRSPSTTISGKDATFHSGYVEAAQRAHVKNKDILYIYCDIMLPNELMGFDDNQPFPLSIGMIITPEKEGKGISFQFKSYSIDKVIPYQPLEFLKWCVFDRKPELTQITEKGAYVWKKKTMKFVEYV